MLRGVSAMVVPPSWALSVYWPVGVLGGMLPGQVQVVFAGGSGALPSCETWPPATGDSTRSTVTVGAVASWKGAPSATR
jgi:hypothetical protein